MKVITLNLWGGKLHKELFDFIKNSEADIFCFQEVFSNLSNLELGLKVINQAGIRQNLFQEIENLRPDMIGFFTPTVDSYYGLAIFVKKDLNIKEHGQVEIYNKDEWQENTDVDWQNRSLQWVKLQDKGKEFTVFNLHGYWTRDGLDHLCNLKQSDKIIKKIKSFTDQPVILMGDFNLRPDTKSIGLIDQHLSNLITKYNIKSTRTSHCPYPIRHADYVFVNDLVKIKSFEVLPDEVSDHHPLMLDFNL